MVTFPPFFQTFSKLLSSIFFGALVSAFGFPSQGTSLPSNFEVYVWCVALPAALTPSVVSVVPPCEASYFSVRLFGAGSPGLYFDFSTLSFHVPSQLSAAR